MPLNGWLTALLGRRMFYALSSVIFYDRVLVVRHRARCDYACDLSHYSGHRRRRVVAHGAIDSLRESPPAEKRGEGMAILGIGAMVGPAHRADAGRVVGRQF